MTAAVIVLCVVVALLSLLVAGLLRSHAEILRRLHELGAGLEPEEGDVSATHEVAMPTTARGRAQRSAGMADPAGGQLVAADVSGVGIAGDPLVLRVAPAPHDTVLLFLSSGCATCVDFWQALRRPGGITLPSAARLVVVTRGPEGESPAELRRLAPRDTMVAMSDQAWVDYDVRGTPYVIHVEGTSGRVIGEGTAATWQQVARLLAQATGDLAYVGQAGPRRRKAAGDADRERAIDRELLGAGILPGDVSLYPPAAAPPVDLAAPAPATPAGPGSGVSTSQA